MMTPSLFYVLFLFSVVLLIDPCNGVLPSDEIYLKDLGLSLYLKNETFKFKLTKQYEVPHSLSRHIIYTGSTGSVKRSLKRALLELSHRNDIELAHDDYHYLTALVDDDLPQHVKLNYKKRNLPTFLPNGIRVIRITNKLAVLSNNIISGEQTLPNGKKRSILAPPSSGTTFCLHIPFLTTCDNKADLDTVRNALQTSVDSIHTELDSYKKTNDARINALARALNDQRNLINQMVSAQMTINNLLGSLAKNIQVNAAQIADGDYTAHSQINYLKRVTNSLLKYADAIASTDPRATVAQPSLTKLFRGFVDSLSWLRVNQYSAIVDYTNQFNWTEIVLPAASVQNTQENPCLAAQTCDIHPDVPATAFSIIIGYTCTVESPISSVAVPSCQTYAPTSATDWIYGPFHKDHYGIYTVSTSSGSTRYMKPIVTPSSTNSLAITPTGTTNCVQFMGYIMLASVTSSATDPLMLNGVSSAPIDSSKCDAFRLVRGTATTTTTIYSLYIETEGVIVPFYSNCDLPTLNSSLIQTLNNSLPAVFSTLNYICSNAWTTSTSTPLPSSCGTVPTSITGYDFKNYHWVTPTCRINLEPGWIELEYYVPPANNTATVSNIPRGFKLEQFTINPAGELASSIEFLYTDTWVPVYKITRVSNNTVIPDEIDLLHKDHVLFYLDQGLVIDESDSFYGKGNNGRDCIVRDQFNYNIFNCYFQNSNQYYTADSYLNGLSRTTGIARYINKFSFVFTFEDGFPTFTYVPKEEADFSFYVSFDREICPSIDDQAALSSGCAITMSYLGTGGVYITNGTTQIPVVFTSGSVVQQVSFGTWNLFASGKNCFGFVCTSTSSWSSVKLITAPFDLISASDLALKTKVNLYSGKTIASTLSSMDNVILKVGLINANLSALKTQLDSINFNVSELFPYEDFTALRSKINQLINEITNPNRTASQTGDAAGCNGPWTSAACWFQDFGAALLVIAICLAIGVIIVVIAMKSGACKKKDGQEDNNTSQFQHNK